MGGVFSAVLAEYQQRRVLEALKQIDPQFLRDQSEIDAMRKAAVLARCAIDPEATRIAGELMALARVPEVKR